MQVNSQVICNVPKLESSESVNFTQCLVPQPQQREKSMSEGFKGNQSKMKTPLFRFSKDAPKGHCLIRMNCAAGRGDRCVVDVLSSGAGPVQAEAAAPLSQAALPYGILTAWPVYSLGDVGTGPDHCSPVKQTSSREPVRFR